MADPEKTCLRDHQCRPNLLSARCVLAPGKLKRTEVLDRLGVKDFARVAQLSAEEAFRLLTQKNNHDHQTAVVSLRNRTGEENRRDQGAPQGRTAFVSIRQGRPHSPGRRLSERSGSTSGKETSSWNQRWRRSPASASGRSWISPKNSGRGQGLLVSEKLPRNGDFILAFRDPSGAPVEPCILVDNKDKATVSEGDIRKLIRDAKERRSPVGIIVAREESQLRQFDRERRWGQEDGVWILRTTRHWLPRDLEVLKPVFERMRTGGPDFLQRNSALAEEIRRTFIDLDEVEKELKRAAKAIDVASVLTAKYRSRLQALCDNATLPKPPGHVDGICRTTGA